MNVWLVPWIMKCLVRLNCVEWVRGNVLNYLTRPNFSQRKTVLKVRPVFQNYPNRLPTVNAIFLRFLYFYHLVPDEPFHNLSACMLYVVLEV